MRLEGIIHSDKGFVICDPAYAMGTKAFYEMCNSDYQSGEREYKGYRVFFTGCDDGTYHPEEVDEAVEVDSGCFGVVPLELCSAEYAANQWYGKVIEQSGDIKYQLMDLASSIHEDRYRVVVLTLPDGWEIRFFV